MREFQSLKFLGAFKGIFSRFGVDYAVMENSDKIKVVAANFEWSDMGSFEAVYDYLKDQNYPMDQNGNLVLGTEKFTGFIGLHNCIFVATSDANLILSKDASQDVKNVYQLLEKEDSTSQILPFQLRIADNESS